MTLLDSLAAIAQVTAEACAPIIAVALLRKVGLDKDAAANTAVTTAITRAAGLAIAEGVKRGDPLLKNETTLHPALGIALSYFQAAAGDAAKRLKVSPDMVAQKLASQLTLTLHVPTVQVATPMVVNNIKEG
jgi:hypothetical protein